MSISLNSLNNTANNHESRIKALENKTSSGYYSEVILWSGNNWNNGFVATLSQSWKNFKILVFLGNAGEMYSTAFYPTSLLTHGTKLCHTYLNYGTIKINNDTQISFPDQGDVGIYKIIGLKLYYSFSYNIIYRATHLLEKIFYVLNKGGVSL